MQLKQKDLCWFRPYPAYQGESSDCKGLASFQDAHFGAGFRAGLAETAHMLSKLAHARAATLQIAILL